MKEKTKENVAIDKSIKNDCFARIGSTKCNALTEKNCENCSFYKKRCEIKDNPYYAYSYKNLKKHSEDVKKYKVNPDDILY